MRRVGSKGETTHKAIRDSGLELIFKHGYEGMTLRQLAGEVGIQAGSLYNHIATKQELLYELVTEHMETLLAALDVALEGIQDPKDRLAAFTHFHVQYHIKHPKEVFVINFELRSLTREHRRSVVALRSRYEDSLIEIIERGQEDGSFRIADAPVAAYGIIGMLTGVASWYKASGRLSAKSIADLYTQLILDGLTQPALTEAVGRYEPAQSGV
jgi:AcrR family transcriptional regulator